MSAETLNRYQIQGRFITQTPLHIGTGEYISRNFSDPQEAPPVQVKACARGYRQYPILPASVLKGVLRQKAEELGLDPELIFQLFGSESSLHSDDERMGGKILFQDGRLDRDSSVSGPAVNRLNRAQQPYMHWDEDRYTYVLNGIAINRATRTVQDNKLYHYEVVPANTAFSFSLCADELTDRELGSILRLLDLWSIHDLTLGAHTAHDFGRMRWQEDRVCGLCSEFEILQWLTSTPKPSGYQVLPDLDPSFVHACREQITFPEYIGDQALHLDIALHFESPFMVNDQTQTSSAEYNGVSHAYLRGENDQPILKSKSFHGALRAQAERIVRTFAPTRACRIETRYRSCDAISEVQNLNQQLCMTCRLFGGDGWRTPLFSSDFEPSEDFTVFEDTQEFVAIDRFHWGSAEKNKFRTGYCLEPVLEGRLSIDMSRIEASHIGLLILTLRDMLEGDVPFGFGWSKGFARCRGRIQHILLPDSSCMHSSCQDIAGMYFEICDHEREISREQMTFDDDKGQILQLFVEAFTEEVS